MYSARSKFTHFYQFFFGLCLFEFSSDAVMHIFKHNADTVAYGVPIVSLQKLANLPSLWTSLAIVWTNHIVMKNCCKQQDKSYRNAWRRTYWFTVPMCQKSLSEHIRLYCKKLIASRTNRIVMHRALLVALLHCCSICRYLGKSKPDRIGIVTCSAFHYADMSSNIFRSLSVEDIAAQWTRSTFLCQNDLICTDSGLWNNSSSETTGTCLCITIWFNQTLPNLSVNWANL